MCLAHHAAVAKTTEPGDVGGRFRADRQVRLFEEWRPLGPEPFALTVPLDAPYSYEGDLLSFYWGIWLGGPASRARKGMSRWWSSREAEDRSGHDGRRPRRQRYR